MERDNKHIGSQSLLKGRVVFEPRYDEQELEEYKNNPFIEVLPPLFDDEDIAERFMMYPVHKPEERQKRKTARYHMIKRLRNFVQPLEIHFDIEQKLSTILRRGYLARNPFSQEYLQRLQLINKAKNEASDKKIDKVEEIGETLRSTAASFSIIGISGIGKTTAIERLLSMYPQVIVHNSYKGKSLTRTQIVWLKIDCPYDGSLKTLCKIFFKSVDDILGTTNYFGKFGNNRNSAATMMLHMTYVASVHCIGVLVIDEIQHLLNSKNDPNEVLNFFVTLVNTIGVPTILIGTFKALQVLQKDFRQARRASAEGNIIWDRMVKNDEWDFFLQTMWDFQWLQHETQLSPELNEVMYDESQGITSVAVNLFILAQERALGSDEKITVNLIREVAKTDLKLIQNMIQALRNNDIDEIKNYDDIMIDMDKILGNVKSKIELRGTIERIAKQQEQLREQEKTEVKDKLFVDLRSIEIFDVMNDRELEQIIEVTIKDFGFNEDFIILEREAIQQAIEKMQQQLAKNSRNKKQKNQKLEDKDLRGIWDRANKQKKPVYDALKKAGFIKNPVTEFYNKEMNA